MAGGMQDVSYLHQKHIAILAHPAVFPGHVALQRVPTVEDLLAVGTEHALGPHVERLDVLAQVGGEARLVRAEAALVQRQPVLIQHARHVCFDKVFAV
jgi:hypothetical protein